MQVVISLVGSKPLLLHNVDLANPLNPWARKMADLRGTPSKRRTEKWHEEMAYTNFMGAFYDIPGIDGIGLPAENVRRSFIDAAKAQRLGTQVQRALMVTVPAVNLIYEGPRTPQQLWDSGKFHLTRMIRGSGGASPTTYPIFHEWAVKAPFELDEELLNIRDLTEIVQRAGRIEGLGASRKQGYGRYDGTHRNVLTTPVRPHRAIRATSPGLDCPVRPITAPATGKQDGCLTSPVPSDPRLAQTAPSSPRLPSPDCPHLTQGGIRRPHQSWPSQPSPRHPLLRHQPSPRPTLPHPVPTSPYLT